MAIKTQNYEVNASKATSLRQSSGSKTMAELMAGQKSSLVAPHKGDKVTGTISKLTPSEILVDINAKTEAVVLEKDKSMLHKILSSVKVGDKVTVAILNPEGDLGNPVVSLRKFIGDIVWEKLLRLQKDQEVLEITVNGATKGGFLVTTLDGISGFLPNSHISTLENPQALIGKNIKTVVFELNRELHKIIFSQKQALGVHDFKKYIQDLKIGQIIEAIISNIASFGIFLSIPVKETTFVEGFIHLSEVSWDNISNLGASFEVSQKIKAVITGFDEDSRRVNLSIKRLTADPLEQKLKEYPIDKKIKGKVIKIISGGVLLDLGDGVSGIIKKDKTPPNVFYEEGLLVDVIVSKIDKKRHRIELTPVLLDKPIGYR